MEAIKWIVKDSNVEGEVQTLLNERVYREKLFWSYLSELSNHYAEIYKRLKELETELEKLK
jgi:hypothetical protein